MTEYIKVDFANADDISSIRDSIIEVHDVEGCVYRNPEVEIRQLEQRITTAISTYQQILIARDFSPSLPSPKFCGFIWFVRASDLPFGPNGVYGLHDNDYVWISYVFTSKEYRGKGIAKLLHRKVEEYCKKEGIPEIMCDVYETNPSSLQFHEKLGFHKKVAILSKEVSFK